jgi:hypothetical protein
MAGERWNGEQLAISRFLSLYVAIELGLDRHGSQRLLRMNYAAIYQPPRSEYRSSTEIRKRALTRHRMNKEIILGAQEAVV